MRKLAAVFVLLLTSATAFGQASQQTWHDIAQQNARKQQKQQQKAYNRSVKKQQKALKKQQKKAAKEAKMLQTQNRH